jgi:hypothetical protein
MADKVRCSGLTYASKPCKFWARWRVVKTGALYCKKHAFELGSYGLKVEEI